VIPLFSKERVLRARVCSSFFFEPDETVTKLPLPSLLFFSPLEKDEGEGTLSEIDPRVSSLAFPFSERDGTLSKKRDRAFFPFDSYHSPFPFIARKK